MTMNDLYFLHYDHNETKSTALSGSQIDAHKEAREFIASIGDHQKVQFKTCLREMTFISTSYLSEEQKVKLNVLSNLNTGDHYQSDDALVFLIELLCGLKSRIIGETEIFGQFKKFYESLSPDQKIMFLPQSTMRFIIESVKSIRDSHIKHWGAHSYGSLIRKIVKNYSSIGVLGFGHLAQEIEPWINEKQVSFYVRNPEKALTEASQKSLQLNIKNSLSDSVNAEVVIVAAPVSSQFIMKLIQNTKLVIDCRALSEQTQSIKEMLITSDLAHIDVIELKDLFESLENEQNQLHEKTKEVKKTIRSLIKDFSLREAHRPQGWYDLCL